MIEAAGSMASECSDIRNDVNGNVAILATDLSSGNRYTFRMSAANTVQRWFLEALAHAKMSQTAIAKEIWAGDRSIPNKIIHGRRRVLAEELEAIRKATGCAPFTGALPAEPPEQPAKFIRSKRLKFYVAEWREFMGAGTAVAASAAGLDQDEYEAFETYPVDFTIGQVAAVADAIGVRPDQFWFPPPKQKRDASATAAAKRSLKR